MVDQNKTIDWNIVKSKVIPAQKLIEALEDDDYTGFCVSCGESHSSIEPDAERCLCEVCEENTVFGAEQILLYTA